MKYDADKIDQAVLALLYLTATADQHGGGRAWKGLDLEALDRLHDKGYIADPKSKSTSVVITAEGMARAAELCRTLFGKSGEDRN